MTRTAFLYASASAVLLLAAPVGAQETEKPSEPSEIVVTGTRDVDKQISDFVGALKPAPADRQLGRFESAVCPAVVGLDPAQKAAVERRLRSVAGAAGMDVAPEGCAVNALLMVAEDKKKFIEALRDRHPQYLGDLGPSDTRRLIRGPGPTASWQLKGVLNARGVRLDDQTSDGGVPTNRTTELSSRITAATRPVFEASALVVERRSLSGLTTLQLADYAAMRLFARTDPARLAGSSAPTIMTILNAPMGSETPLTLTKWDLGLLRGLYGSANNSYAGAQRSAIARQIEEERVREESSPKRKPRN